MPEGETVAPVRRRKPRIPAAVARQRMLDAGAALVERDGLTVGFSHLPLEEIIGDAGVSRASAYRQWRTHDAYVADLISEVFDREEMAFGLSPATTDSVMRGIREHAERLETAEGRLAVMRELVRVAAERNLRDLLSSRRWRSYETLYTASESPGDPALAELLQSAARSVEQQLVDTNVGFYRAALSMMGQRMRAPYTTRTLAIASHVVVSGYAHRIHVDPSLAELYVDGPALDGGTTRWHMAAHLTFQAIEPLIEDAETAGAAAADE